MKLEELIQFAQVFLVAISVLAVALADARNEKLKTGLSVAGALLSASWFLSTVETLSVPNLSFASRTLALLPIATFFFWVLSVWIHVQKWRRDKARQNVDIRDAIIKALANHAAAAVQADPRAAASVFTVDVRLMEPNMPDVNGRDSVETMLAAVWSAATPREVRFTTEELYTFPDVAFEVGIYAYTVEPKGQPSVADRGRYMGMWKRAADGTWHLHRFIENTSLPAPAR